MLRGFQACLLQTPDGQIDLLQLGEHLRQSHLRADIPRVAHENLFGVFQHFEVIARAQGRLQSQLLRPGRQNANGLPR